MHTKSSLISHQVLGVGSERKVSQGGTSSTRGGDYRIWSRTDVTQRQDEQILAIGEIVCGFLQDEKEVGANGTNGSFC